MNARPNFVFILADDLGYADLGCTGSREPVSPNLDRLASDGLLFRHGYSNSPVCSPTRFALITGRYQYYVPAAADEPLSGRAQGSTTLGLPPTHPTLPSLLRDAGYATALIGKWHLGYPPHFGPLKSGYQTFFGPMSGGVDYFTHRDRSRKHDLWDGEVESRQDGYLTDLISTRAAEYIQAHDASKPFLLSVHYTAPHWPWETREDEAESARVVDNIGHLDGGSIATYRRMIQHMDEGIGRIVGALKTRGLEDNTLIVFTSDNGGERFSDNWPFIGQKMDLMEGGIRVPLIARWPARISLAESAAPVITMDWTATMLAAANVTPHPEYPLDGVDLAPLFADSKWSPQRDLYWRMLHRQQRALRRGTWKYLRADGHEYLFDLGRDERERANLARREPEIFNELRSGWEAWAATMPGIPADAKVSLIFGEADMPRATH